MVQTPERGQMHLQQRHGEPDAGAPPSSLQSVEIPLWELWKEVEMAVDWKAGSRRNVQVSELFSMEMCDKAVMDFLTATHIGKFPLGCGRRCLALVHSFFLWFSILVSFLFHYVVISRDGG